LLLLHFKLTYDIIFVYSIFGLRLIFNFTVTYSNSPNPLIPEDMDRN